LLHLLGLARRRAAAAAAPPAGGGGAWLGVGRGPALACG
jgi:hypothetical protein